MIGKPIFTGDKIVVSITTTGLANKAIFGRTRESYPRLYFGGWSRCTKKKSLRYNPFRKTFGAQGIGVGIIYPWN